MSAVGVDVAGVDADHGGMVGPSEPRPLDGVDVRGVAEALDDGDRDTAWWYDPSTGQVELGVVGVDRRRVRR